MVEGAEVIMLLYNGSNHYDACWPEGPLPPVRVDWLGTKAAALVVETWQHEKQHETFEFETLERAGEGHGFEVWCHCLSRAGWTDPEPLDMQRWEREQEEKARRLAGGSANAAPSSSGTVKVAAPQVKEEKTEEGEAVSANREGGTSTTTRFAPRSGSKTQGGEEASKPSQGDLQASTEAMAAATVKQEPGTQQAAYVPPIAPRARRALEEKMAKAAATTATQAVPSAMLLNGTPAQTPQRLVLSPSKRTGNAGLATPGLSQDGEEEDEGHGPRDRGKRQRLAVGGGGGSPIRRGSPPKRASALR